MDSGAPNTIPSSSDVQQNADQGREYGCKYCAKAFSNKQALGGHQNAHKIQRAMEKAAREAQEDKHFGREVEGGGPANFPGPDLFDRSVVNNFPYYAPQVQQYQHQHQHQGMSVSGIARPVPGYNIFSQGWTASRPRGIIVPQLPGHGGHHYVQTNGLNFRFADRGAASGSGAATGSRPVYRDMSGFAAARVRPGGRDNRNGTNEDGSGLDLSLKL